MFVTTSSTVNNNNHPPSYIVAAATNLATTANNGIDAAANNSTSQTLSDIKLICLQRKKVCLNVVVNINVTCHQDNVFNEPGLVYSILTRLVR